MDQEQKNENMINPDKDRGQKEETDDLLSSSSNCHSNEFLRQLLIIIHANIAIVDYLHEELRKREEILEELKANSAKIPKWIIAIPIKITFFCISFIFNIYEVQISIIIPDNEKLSWFSDSTFNFTPNWHPTRKIDLIKPIANRWKVNKNHKKPMRILSKIAV